MVMGFKKIVLKPQEVPNGFHLTQIQDNTNQALKEISNIALLKGVFVAAFLTTGVDNSVDTGLGRQYQGFIVVDIDANATVWRSTTANPFPDKMIFLRSSANTSVTLYIF